MLPQATAGLTFVGLIPDAYHFVLYVPSLYRWFKGIRNGQNEKQVVCTAFVSYIHWDVVGTSLILLIG